MKLLLCWGVTLGHTVLVLIVGLLALAWARSPL